MNQGRHTRSKQNPVFPELLPFLVFYIKITFIPTIPVSRHLPLQILSELQSQMQFSLVELHHMGMFTTLNVQQKSRGCSTIPPQLKNPLILKLQNFAFAGGEFPV